MLAVVCVVGVGFVLSAVAKLGAANVNGLTNVNTAAPDELALNLQMNPDLAARFVKWRSLRGAFSSTREALHVPVIADRSERRYVEAALLKGAVDVNTASARELETGLRLDPDQARRLVEIRAGLDGKRFKQPTDLLQVPLLNPLAPAIAGNQIVVRTRAAVLGLLLAWVPILLACFLGVGPVVRKLGCNGDTTLLPIVCTLSGLGVIGLFSSHNPLTDPLDFQHQIVGIILGLCACVVAALLPGTPGSGRRLPARSRITQYTYIWAVAAVALGTLLEVAGTGPAGVRLSVAFFQPIEVVKVLLILFSASYLSQRTGLITHAGRPTLLRQLLPPWRECAPMLAIYLGALLLFLVVHDLGPALLLFAVFASMLFVASGKSAVGPLALALVVLGFVVADILHIGVVPVRVAMWAAPWHNSYSRGMQLGQSLWAFASGGIGGTGLGLGLTGAIPRSRDDLIFAALGEELGLVGLAVIIGLFCLLLGRCLRCACRAVNSQDRHLSVGIAALLLWQTILIMGGVTGLTPLTGITLPFIAYGTTSLVCAFFLAGLQLGISASVAQRNQATAAESHSIRSLASALALCLLVGVFGLRLLPIQGVIADSVASMPVRTPDADKVTREKWNPRLLGVEQAIERGSIYDRKGAVLATSKLAEISRLLPDNPPTARYYYRRGRYYPLGGAAAHVVGYVDPGQGGPVGAERQFNSQLRGFISYSELVTDYRYRDLPSWFSPPPHRSSNVWLSLDAHIQQEAFDALHRVAATASRGSRLPATGAVVVIEPSTGDVLAEANIPTYNPNAVLLRSLRVASGDTARSPLLDRARTGLYPPGSTFKLVTASAALRVGIDPVVLCVHEASNLRWTYRGAVYFRRRLVDDVHDPPHGLMHMPEALAKSCNVYFANLGLTLGPDELFDEATNVYKFRHVSTLTDVAAGLPETAFGQGRVLVTPLEMARTVAGVANEGRMMKPRYLLRLSAAVGGPGPSPELLGVVLKPRQAAALGRMMRQTVELGTAAGAFSDLSVTVAGKTGTAQLASGRGAPDSWFVGYAPYVKPRMAFAVVIEHGGYGRLAAVPVIHRLLRALY